ncbi:PucR family transcriptional regulator [Salisediminibacterium halotolerans]|uniref:Purine catabolism regulatory protein n=1 Tax=Salisediminibacterium halotolerans TaxID=517425 RepID=A0A1H9QKQ2_9BACI|nr:PucR family transcriptional regulator [Salisediminibacterium haloalkalitolerans]SER60987.1 purine catabolism regulatory protein [Salisediminibacterium haloalkalitolerans]
MSITVKTALRIGGLRECRVVAGQDGLDGELNYVTIMEVPDITRWLKGNELLLTSMYPIKEDLEAQRRLIRSLHEKGTAALAIKPNRFIREIPAVVLEEADKYGFPVIEIPEHISYLDILSPVMNKIFDKKTVLQEDIEAAYHLLNEISLNKTGLRHFVDVLKNLTKHKIAIESLVSFMDEVMTEPALEPLSYRQVQELEHARRPIRLVRETAAGDDVSCITAPIILDGTLYGVISSWDHANDHQETDLAIFERAAAILSLEFMRRKVKHEVEFQYKREFLRSLLHGEFVHTAELVEQARSYNIFPEKRYVCCAIHFDQAAENDSLYSKHMAQFENKLKTIEPEAVLGTMHHILYLLFPTDKRSAETVSASIKQVIREFSRMVGRTAYAGVGRKADEEIEGLKAVFDEAKLALSIGRTLDMHGESFVHYDELGVFRLLANVERTEDLQKFYDETIGLLAVYDAKHNLDLVRSVEAYFQHNESVSQAANALFIHVNTLKYRLQKVSALTGQNIQTSEGKLNLQIGLKISYFIRHAR